MKSGPGRGAVAIKAAALALWLLTGTAQAGTLSVNPVKIRLPAGQQATTLTVRNDDNREASFQVRAYVWKQAGGSNRLTPTNQLVVSPPLGAIPPHASQTIRLVLRTPPQGQEASYRILLDQIPPPSAPGTVNIALRFSLPVFAEPASRITPNVRWLIERSAKSIYLVAINDGSRHVLFSDITLFTPYGTMFKPGAQDELPYVLAGAMRRWRLASNNRFPAPGAKLRLTAKAESGNLDVLVPVVATPMK